MAIPNYTSYRAKLKGPYQTLHSTKASASTVAGRLNSLWAIASDGGAVPTSPVVPVNTTAGGFGQKNSAGVQRIANATSTVTSAGNMMIVDRLSHQGGLSGIVTTPQTTNLPTAPLTRYSSGQGVFMALEIYVAIGTTATTVIASYTNSDGVAGRTSEVSIFGGTGFREAIRIMVLPLQEGDQGVRSVESVTVAATTGTAGNFGVTLFKPLMCLPVMSFGFQPMYFDSILNLCGNLPRVENNACLQWLVAPSASFSGTSLSSIQIIEE